VQEIGPQAFGNGKRPEPVRDVRQRVLDQVFRPEENSLLVARGAEKPRLAGKGNDFTLI